MYGTCRANISKILKERSIKIFNALCAHDNYIYSRVIQMEQEMELSEIIDGG